MEEYQKRLTQQAPTQPNVMINDCQEKAHHSSMTSQEPQHLSNNFQSTSPPSGSIFNLLPEDVIFLIVRFLHPRDICRLGCVNRHFYFLTSRDVVWHCHAKRLAVVRSPKHCYRQDCGAKELCKIGSHWRQSLYQDRFAWKDTKRLIPWLVKEGREIWYSTGNTIRNFQVTSSGVIQGDPNKTLKGMTEDATKFVLKNNTVISGCRDGGVYGWDTSGLPLFAHKAVHKNDTQCLDASDRLIITGSRDASCKMLPLHPPPHGQEVKVIQTLEMGERVWSVKISPDSSMFAAGLAGDIVPLMVWDVETGSCVSELGSHHRRGAGVLDLQFESPHLLLTCGYDTFLRLWDLRTFNCVSQWEDPHDNALYCMASDGANTMAVGSCRHGLVSLWDKRHSHTLKSYYSSKSSSPVYSLGMDFGHLYLALDMGLNVMDFVSGHSKKLTTTLPLSWRRG